MNAGVALNWQSKWFNSASLHCCGATWRRRTGSVSKQMKLTEMIKWWNDKLDDKKNWKNCRNQGGRCPNTFLGSVGLVMWRQQSHLQTLDFSFTLGKESDSILKSYTVQCHVLTLNKRLRTNLTEIKLKKPLNKKSTAQYIVKCIGSRSQLSLIS